MKSDTHGNCAPSQHKMDKRPDQSLKDMAKNESRGCAGVCGGLCWRLASSTNSTNSGIERPFPSCLVSLNMSPEPQQLASLTRAFLFQSSLTSLCLKRALILDYLVQRCYTRTARAFAADSTIRHLDADGDELPRPRIEDDSPGVTEDALHLADLRQGAYSFVTLCSLPH